MTRSPETKDQDQADLATKDEPDGTSRSRAAKRQTSRLERLKQKVKKMQGKNPDIYPMW